MTVRYQRVRPRRKTRQEQFIELSDRITKIEEAQQTETDPQQLKRYRWVWETLMLRWMSLNRRLYEQLGQEEMEKFIQSSFRK